MKFGEGIEIAAESQTLRVRCRNDNARRRCRPSVPCNNFLPIGCFLMVTQIAQLIAFCSEISPVGAAEPDNSPRETQLFLIIRLDPEIYSSAERRRNVQKNIFFAESHPTLESSIHKLKDNVSAATIGSQLLAAIAENPNVDNLSSLFHSHCFAFYTPQKDLAALVVESAQEEILDSDDGQPLAIAASPIQLTPFGVAANRGGLSPKTARILRNTLASLTEQEPSLQNLVNVSVTLLEALANTPEQTNSDLRKAVESPKNRPVVRRKDLHFGPKTLAGRQVD